MPFCSPMAHSNRFRPVRTSSQVYALCHPGVAVSMIADRPENSKDDYHQDKTTSQCDLPLCRLWQATADKTS